MNKQIALQHLGQRVVVDAGALGIYTGVLKSVEGDPGRWLGAVSIDGILALPKGKNRLPAPGDEMKHRGIGLRPAPARRKPHQYLSQLRDLLEAERKSVEAARRAKDGLAPWTPAREEAMTSFALRTRERDLRLMQAQAQALFDKAQAYGGPSIDSRPQPNPAA
jgi:hypothetical protein